MISSSVYYASNLWIVVLRIKFLILIHSKRAYCSNVFKKTVIFIIYMFYWCLHSIYDLRNRLLRKFIFNLKLTRIPAANMQRFQFLWPYWLRQLRARILLWWPIIHTLFLIRHHGRIIIFMHDASDLTHHHHPAVTSHLIMKRRV